MQFNLISKEIVVFPCIRVHDGAICLAVSGLMHTCIGSHRSYGLSVGATIKWLFSVVVLLLVVLLPSLYPPFFFALLSQCDGCQDVSVWGLMAGLRGLLAIGAFNCLGAG